MRPLRELGALSSRRPRTALAIGAALALAGLALASSIEISASRFELIGLRSADAQNDLVVAVRSSDAALGRAAADAIAAELARRADVSAVLCRLGGSSGAVGRAGEAQLETLVAALEGEPGVEAVVRAALARIEGEGETLDALGDEIPLEDDPRRGLRSLASLLAELARWIEEPARARLGPAEPVDADGYLVSRDGQTRYLLVTPAGDTDRYEAVRPLVEAARAQAAARTSDEVHVEVTGYPALAVDEVETIRGSTLWTGGLAAALALLLFLAAFRSPRGVVFVGVPLAVGVAVAFGGIALVFGRLNLLTQAAAPVFIGLGIDFGTHLVSAYARRRSDGDSHDAALEGAMDRPARAVLVGGLTSAAACFTLPLARLGSPHDAFAELGYVAGGGLLCVLVAVLVLTPALLSLDGARAGGALTLHAPTGLARAAPPRWLTWAILGLTGGLAVGAGFGVARLGFAVDVEALLPERAPSLVAARRMREESALSTEHLVARASDLAAAARLSDALRARPSVGRVHSASDLVWLEPSRRAALLRRGARAAEAPRILPASDAPRLERALGRLSVALAGVAREVEGVGGAAASAELVEARAQIEVTRERLRRAEAAPRLAAFEAALEARLAEAARELRAGVRGAPLTIATLPPELRTRYVAPDGSLRVFAEPASGILEGAALDAFVEDVRADAPSADGAPVALARFLASMREALVRAAGLALLVVTLVLAFDLRRASDVLLALTPIALGVLGTLGLLGWCGVSLDMAGCAALPLVLGVGVDDGVHLVHRCREEPDVGRALGAVRRALVLTTLTTMAGFGALGLSAHRGMQSFALVMVVGAALCLLVTLVVVPALVRLRSS